MNLIPRPKPVSLRRRLTMAMVNAVLVTAPVAVAVHLPLEMTYAAPEHGAAATQAQRQYERALEKCVALPAGTLPGGAVIDWKGDRPTAYTEVHAEVSLAFQRAVGEAEAPRIAALTLCR